MEATVRTDPIAARLDALQRQIAWLVEREEKRGELLDEMTPILREMMGAATVKLDAAEKRGWLAFARELAALGEKVLDHYSADDVRAFGDVAIGILDAVREHGGDAKPVGLIGAMRAARKPDVQKGIGVVMQLLGAIGRSATGKPHGGDRKAALAGLLAPRRRLALPAHEAPRAAAAPPVASVVDGVAFGADGHLADPSVWDRALGDKIAATLGVALLPEHWKLIAVARADWEANRAAANIRRLTQISGLSTRDIYALFPKAPGRTIARIAGTPKPAGCI